jgi:TRAP-type C4-dicarboxylate transport system permease small subunit
MRRIKSIFDGAANGLAFFGALLILFIMVTVTIDVVMRYFLNRPIFWVAEVAEYALLFIAFTGTAWVLKHDMHVKIDILTGVLNEDKARALEIVVCILGIFICAVLTYFGALVAWDHHARGVYNPSLLSWPKAPILAVIPVGTLLMTVQFILKMVTLLRKGKAE